MGENRRGNVISLPYKDAVVAYDDLRKRFIKEENRFCSTEEGIATAIDYAKHTGGKKIYVGIVRTGEYVYEMIIHDGISKDILDTFDDYQFVELDVDSAELNGYETQSDGKLTDEDPNFYEVLEIIRRLVMSPRLEKLTDKQLIALVRNYETMRKYCEENGIEWEKPIKELFNGRWWPRTIFVNVLAQMHYETEEEITFPGDFFNFVMDYLRRNEKDEMSMCQTAVECANEIIKILKKDN